MCGMTRGVTSLVNGDFAHALLMNPASYLAVALAIVLLVQWRMKRVVVPVWLIAVMLAVMWTWQLFKYATGRPL
jgi:MFS superfamily sulfate permease-like transporter